MFNIYTCYFKINNDTIMKSKEIILNETVDKMDLKVCKVLIEDGSVRRVALDAMQAYYDQKVDSQYDFQISEQPSIVQESILIGIKNKYHIGTKFAFTDEMIYEAMQEYAKCFAEQIEKIEIPFDEFKKRPFDPKNNWTDFIKIKPTKYDRFKNDTSNT